jgi:hypothetical protein
MEYSISSTKLCAGLSDLYQIKSMNGSATNESIKLYERLRELEADKLELGEFFFSCFVIVLDLKHLQTNNAVHRHFKEISCIQ